MTEVEESGSRSNAFPVRKFEGNFSIGFLRALSNAIRELTDLKVNEDDLDPFELINEMADGMEKAVDLINPRIIKGELLDMDSPIEEIFELLYDLMAFLGNSRNMAAVKEKFKSKRSPRR